MTSIKKWIVFYNSKGEELAAYTEAGTFAGELKATTELLAFEHGIHPKEIIIKDEERLNEREVFIMEKNITQTVKELLGDYDRLHALLWDMMAEAYTTKQNYLNSYCLMVWEDGSITTNFMQQNQRYRGEDEGTAYCVATIKEWNNDEHDEWEEPDDDLIDTAKRIMMEYKEQIDDEIRDIIEQATWNYEHLD